MLVRSSRRESLASAATVAATAMAVEPGPVLAYAGTYSAPVGAEGAPGRGQGIYLFEMNLATGALVERAVFPTAPNLHFCYAPRRGVGWASSKVRAQSCR
jgi:hypothetical protein